MPRNAEEILAEAFQRREYRYLDDEPEFNLHHNEQATQHELVDDSDNMRIEQGKEEDEDSRILGHIHPTSPLLFANKLKSDRTIDTSSALNARRQLRSSKSRTIRGKSSGKRVQGKASSSSIHSAISVSTGRLSLALADSLEPTDTDVLNAQPVVDDTTAISTELNNHSAVTDASNRSEPIDVPVIAQDRDILASSGKTRPTPLESLTSEEDDDEDEAKVQSNMRTLGELWQYIRSTIE
ncbi:hypothetical protein BDF22DRAFT_735207 [Syncephalis plumigaleata]|nr:hypothetical protein BDF22DRAFT_735207 [Syncephalis plumigaleata]